MTLEKLAAELSRVYRNAPEGEQTTMIHLFGIKYVDEIRQCGSSANEIVRQSEISDKYGTEVRKGMRLARYVSLRPDRN